MTTAPATYTAVNWQGRLLAAVTATLAVFGVAAVYGASSIVAVQSGEPGSAFAFRQLIGVVLGGVGLLIAARVDYHIWQRLAWPMILVAFAFLLLPYVPGLRSLTPEFNGARRLFSLGPLRFQPSEFAKFAVVAWCAMLAARKGDQVRQFKRGLLPFLVVVGPLCLLILFQPNLSTATLAALLMGVVLFTAGARIGHFLLLFMVSVPLVWHELTQVQYRLARMVTFLSSGTEASEASWQIQQSLIGMGSGRAFGVGFGEGMQKLGYLPLAYSDFVFSTIGEEWGFVGVAVIVVLFALWIWMGLRIARGAPDLFGMLLATGLTTMIGVTAILHMAVTLAMVPTTGQPLPFVSYGRTALLVALVATGVIISVGRQAARGR
jgi:cell division protein FtsW